MTIYKYDISMTYIYNNTPITFKAENFHNLLIDYDYDDKNMPVMYATVTIDKNVLDDMVINSTKKYVVLTVKKYVGESSTALRDYYIHDEFMYFLPKSINADRNVDYNATNTNDVVNKTITMGFISLKIMNNNKQLINDIFIDTNVTGMICKYASNMNLLLEPPAHNEKKNRIIIPPLSSFTEFISYINSKIGLYDTNYRLFYDFDKTYLISSSGNIVKSKSDKADTIILGIKDTNKEESKVQGMELINGSYSINIDMDDVSVFTNEVNTLQFNSLIGISSDGKFKKVDLSDERIDNKEKFNIIRYTTDTLNNVDISKSNIEGNTDSVNIVKSDLDGSVFTINKEYKIMNYYKLDYLTGNYMLKRKREIYTSYGNEFTLSTMLSLNKIKS